MKNSVGLHTILDMKTKDKDQHKQETPQEPDEHNIPVPDINVDENIGGTAHLNERVPEESELEKLTSELREMRDKYLRLVAEFDNFRKRNAKERVELMQTAGREVIVSLLEVLDDCERATVQIESASDINAVKDGVLLVFNKLKSLLQSKGLREMDSLHTMFDPDLHDAMAEIPAPSEDLKGKVIENLQKGYYLNDKLIRHAKVVVGK